MKRAELSSILKRCLLLAPVAANDPCGWIDLVDVPLLELDPASGSRTPEPEMGHTPSLEDVRERGVNEEGPQRELVGFGNQHDLCLVAQPVHEAGCRFDAAHASPNDHDDWCLRCHLWLLSMRRAPAVTITREPTPGLRVSDVRGEIASVRDMRHY